MTVLLPELSASSMTGYEVIQSLPIATHDAPTSAPRIRNMREISVDSLVSPGTGYRLATDTRRRNFTESLRSIQQRSGLDWGQLAEVLGVSRRTVHNWIGGATVNGENAKRITALYNALIQELRGVVPVNARSYLLSPAEDGTTRLSVISRHIRQEYKRTRPVVRAHELLAYAPIVDTPTQTGGIDESMNVILLDEGDER